MQTTNTHPAGRTLGLIAAMAMGAVGCAGVSLGRPPTPKVRSLDLSTAPAQLQDEEIVLMQHVGQAREAALRATYASRYPHFAVHRSANCEGLAVMSRWPIQEQEVVQAMSKGRWYPALRVMIDAPTGEIQVLAMHPASHAPATVARTGRLSRLRHDLPSVVMSPSPRVRVHEPGDPDVMPVVAVFGGPRTMSFARND